MSLREHLRKILPEILPPAPKSAIKGTELIELVKLKLDEKYSDATLRYHFSIMSCDPSSPIAKVEHGQGYYLRTNTLNSMKSARHMISTSQANFGDESDYEDLWKYPDIISVSWKAGLNNKRSELDEDMLHLQKSFGSQPFTLRSIKMKLEIHEESYREDFFQCLSNSRWAHYGELIIASPIESANTINNLRELGQEFGIGITSYGMSKETLDDLPEPGAIQHFSEREIEGLFGLIHYQKISESRPRNELAWEQVSQLRNSNQEIESMFKWLSNSLDQGKVLNFDSKVRETRNITEHIID